MKVADTFSANGGFVVVGSDPDVENISDDEFKGLRARNVSLVDVSGRRWRAEVAEVTISRSLAGQRNIMIGFKEGPDMAKDYIGGRLTWES